MIPAGRCASCYAALWVDSLTSVLTVRGPQYQFPASKTTTWLLSYAGGEEPDPLATCPAAWRRRIEQLFGTVGLPIIFGNLNTVSKPTASVTVRGKALRVCVVNAGNAVFVIPLLPLAPHRTFTVTVSYRGKLQSRWYFRTS